MEKELHDVLCEQLDRLYQFAYNRTRDSYKAEDLTQEIVLSALRSYHGIRDKNLILPWLWGIARNVFLRSVRANREIPVAENYIIDSVGISYETPEEKYIANEEIFNLRRAVSYLAKNYRDVVVMYYLEEKDYNTISNELSIPLSSVKWRLNQSKSQIREELEKMDYMSNGYRKAQNLFTRFGGWVGKSDWRGSYEGADTALKTLLAKNIAILAYEKPMTVTELASALGTSADYVEDILNEMLETRVIENTSNKYQTAFPIIDGEQEKDIYLGNLNMAKEKVDKIFDMLYNLKDDIKNLGFYGCDKDFESLLPMLISTVCKETKGNMFDVDKLPFKGTDKSWYILGCKEDRQLAGLNGGGLSWSGYGSMNNSIEYYVSTPGFKDRRSEVTAQVLDNFYSFDDIDTDTNTEFLEREAHHIALLIEEGKLEKIGDRYKIKVPIFDETKGEYQKLTELLSPVIEFTDSLQAEINKRSLDTVRKYIPKRLNCDEFFGTYFTNYIIDAAFFDLLHEKNITFTGDMLSWFVFKMNTDKSCESIDGVSFKGPVDV